MYQSFHRVLSFAIQTFRYSHMELFSHLGCLVCGILSFVFLIYSNAFLIFWHSHKCAFSYLYFSQLGCPSFTKYQFCLSLFCHSQQDVPSFVCPSFTSLPPLISTFPKRVVIYHQSVARTNARVLSQWAKYKYDNHYGPEC